MVKLKNNYNELINKDCKKYALEFSICDQLKELLPEIDGVRNRLIASPKMNALRQLLISKISDGCNIHALVNAHVCGKTSKDNSVNNDDNFLEVTILLSPKIVDSTYELKQSKIVLNFGTDDALEKNNSNRGLKYSSGNSQHIGMIEDWIMKDVNYEAMNSLATSIVTRERSRKDFDFENFKTSFEPITDHPFSPYKVYDLLTEYVSAGEGVDFDIDYNNFDNNKELFANIKDKKLEKTSKNISKTRFSSSI
jgi:hypothetical protein